jgi:hypothetical protein
MDLNVTTINNESIKSIESSLDPDLNANFGFWLNGVGIIVIGLFGIYGNLTSIRVLFHKQMRSSMNFILIALAVSDLCLIFTSILLFGLTTIYPYNGKMKFYFFITVPKLAHVAYPLGSIAQSISIYLTFLISLERYVAVCHPLKAATYCKPARTKMFISIVVVSSIIYNLPKFFEIELKEFNNGVEIFYLVSASALRVNKLYIAIYIHWLYFIVMNLIPFFGITFFNLMIYRQVRIVNRIRSELTSKEIQDIKLTTILVILS